jgi:hypothetical protein
VLSSGKIVADELRVEAQFHGSKSTGLRGGERRGRAVGAENEAGAATAGASLPSTIGEQRMGSVGPSVALPPSEGNPGTQRKKERRALSTEVLMAAE